MSAAQLLDYERVLPADSGFHARTTLSVSGTAANLDLNGTWSGVANRVQKGGAFLTIEAPSGVDLYVLAKATATAAAATTTTGVYIAGGTRDEFWISPGRPVLDIIASASGTAKFYFSSRTQAVP